MAYATLAEVREYLNAQDVADDTLLTRLLAAAQRIIEDKTGKVFEASADAIHYFDAVRDVRGSTLWLDANLCAITSVVNGDGATITASQYVTEPRNEAPYYALRLKASSGLVWTWTTDPEDAIVITGKWAYSPTAPASIAQATARLAGYLYRLRDAQVFDVTAQPGQGVITIPKGIPADVMMDLRPYLVSM